MFAKKTILKLYRLFQDIKISNFKVEVISGIKFLKIEVISGDRTHEVTKSLKVRLPLYSNGKILVGKQNFINYS